MGVKASELDVAADCQAPFIIYYYFANPGDIPGVGGLSDFDILIDDSS